MFKYFSASFFVTIFGLIGAYLWGNHVHAGSGLTCIFIASILAILEISLSFDNAVVNAMKLEKMSEKWRHRFITWGILIAVFGMRFLFPLLIVSIFAGISIVKVFNIALYDVNQYTHYLQQTHAPIVAFGGAFLLMLFINYFTNEDKSIYWLNKIETSFQNLKNLRGRCSYITLLVLGIVLNVLPNEQRIPVLISGLSGIIVYLIIENLAKWLEKRQEERARLCAETIRCSGFIGFLYLELIDASFSLDGVLGAFALSQDIIIITIGLFIGAMFVRSLTIMLVEKKTLNKYIYLEHGAHWAIGALSVLMFLSTIVEVPEVITGLIGFIFILCAFISSLIHNKNSEPSN